MPTIIIDAERCKQCMLCVEFCPKGVLEVGGATNTKGYYPVRRKDGAKCTACGICQLICPSVCIEVHRDE
ncbi:MAG TPA: ferredoxin family protein [Armatimonadota bacterium]|nr:ferredoxin family protein [Armatimonadota bacterium]